MKKQIAVLAGDGVGPEVTEQAVRFLEAAGAKFDHQFTFIPGLIGAAAIDKTNSPFPEETEKLCLESDAILLGAIGDPKFDNDPSAKVRPEQGILALRKALGLYANIRPIEIFPSVAEKSPLKAEIIKDVNFVVVRELIGGIYFGKRGRTDNGNSAFDTSEYSKKEIIRISEYGFRMAQKRNKKLTVVDKANVLETSRLWRETVQSMEKDYPDVTVEYMFVDNAAMQIIKRPSVFDVVLTENMFGDILTDEASVITGSLGMLPSASIGLKTALFEPIHGSFPKAAGQNYVNPIATMLSAAMMLEYSFGLKKERDAMYNAVQAVLDAGYGTKDIATQHTLSTSELADKIIAAL